MGMLSITGARGIDRIAVLAGFALVSCSFYFLRISDADLWWHIKAGEIIFTTGDAPRFDGYSFTAPHARWIDHEWLTHAGFYYLYSRFGDGGLTVFKTLLGVATATFVFLLTRVTRRGVHLLVFLLTTDIVAFYALYRPQMVSYFFVALMVLLLARKEAMMENGLYAASVPLIVIVWANLHGGFLAGLALIGAHVAILFFWNVLFDRGRGNAREWRVARRLMLILVTSALLTLVNPYGSELWRALAHELSANALNRQYVQEWAALWFSFGLDGCLFLFVAALAALAFAMRPKRWTVEETLLSFATFILSLYSVRNIPFFALIVARPLARSLNEYLRESQQMLARGVFVVAFAVALLPAVLKTYFVIRDPDPSIEVKSPMPRGAVAFMVANHAAGNLFNPLGWGGYLLWHSPDSIKISIDGRSSTVYAREVLSENYRFYTNQTSAEVPALGGADFVLTEAAGSVMRKLSSDPRWTAIYSDKVAALFAAATPAGKRLIELKRAGKLIAPVDPQRNGFP